MAVAASATEVDCAVAEVVKSCVGLLIPNVPLCLSIVILELERLLPRGTEGNPRKLPSVGSCVDMEP